MIITRMSATSGPESAPAGLVVACHGRHLRLRIAGGAEVAARPARRALEVVCGDEVEVRHDAQHDEWHVIGVRPRRTALYRSDARGAGELVAANVGLLLVVLAARPRSDPFIADRYLAAAASEHIDACVVANKRDLDADAELDAALAGLQLAGYRVLDCSARTGAGLDALRAAIGTRTAMLVGESGVGKSSLTRVLVPHSEVEVGELARDRGGRHTTTAVRLYDLPGGGRLLDAPGVRDFAPAIDRLDAATLGFVEVARLAGGCRFADCRHLAEPGCAVRAASESGAMDPRRYESYRRLRRLHAGLTARQGERRRS